MIVIICVIIAVIILSVVIAYFVFKRFKNPVLDNHSVKPIEQNSSRANSNISPDMQSAEDQYENQYHPNNIFNKNDMFFKKGNNADDVVDDDED